MKAVVFSLDAELAWGSHDLHPLDDDEERAIEAARPAWTRLLDLFDRFGLPATWAVVGHLFLKDTTDLDRDHPLGRTWFQRFEADRVDRPDRWSGRDLIERISAVEVDHEIACHSYSHAVFDEISREAAEAELRLSQLVARRNNLWFDTFVFPRNAIAHEELLGDHGFSCFRGQHRPPLPGLDFAKNLGAVTTGHVSPRIVQPKMRQDGVVEVPASFHLLGFDDGPWRFFRRFDRKPAVELSRLAMERVRDNGGLFHAWLHPNDLRSDRDFGTVQDVLEMAARFSEQGDLSVLTMRDVARRFRTATA